MVSSSCIISENDDVKIASDLRFRQQSLIISATATVKWHWNIELRKPLLATNFTPFLIPVP
ncbi:hypothetical protein JHK82_014670 [Glycine max]|uniref:Uncharacterized protein n=2 Tax=Glycine subgen. Soja TaxID=1462606 RepID=K7KTR8_SOYBN|nr:hypothetical protein JHK87_014587 [Glycine soja]KAG5031055.1 hypothetical protein JHK85_015037 [Glycine max]KAG5045283.1 hypothetical protein JHK86_014689 [Glycine max]KAG5147789.1 hypothetical protein JHK82_014670 [Glycine max]KAH1124708.1 hypothetical protein GYH30_014408 [Glycine max]